MWLMSAAYVSKFAPARAGPAPRSIWRFLRALALLVVLLKGCFIQKMKKTLIRLASAAKPRRSTRPHRENASPLLPPLALYRRILRAHKVLPQAQRELGNMYVREEFKAHKSTDNPLYIVGFLTSWQDYLQQITHAKWMEGSLTQAQLEKMSPDQVNQLYELMKEAQRVRDGKALDEDE